MKATLPVAQKANYSLCESREKVPDDGIPKRVTDHKGHEDKMETHRSKRPALKTGTGKTKTDAGS